MYGYWEDKAKTTEQNNNNTGEGAAIEIGLPPILRPTKNGAYTEGLYIAGEGSDWTRIDLTDVNVRCFKKTLNPGTYSTPDWPYPDKDGDYYMYLPAAFKGYITEAEDSPSVYKTILKGDPNAATITSQKVYKIGIDVYKLVFPDLGGADFHTGSIYGDVEKAAQIFKNRLFSDSNIPIFTGNFRPNGSGGGVNTLASIKQNRHYAAVGRKSGSVDLLTPGMSSRYFIRKNNNFNTDTYGSGAGDTMYSNGSAEGGVLRNGRTTIGTKVYDWATSGTNAGILPWGINLTSGSYVMYNSTNGNIVDTTRPRIQPFTSRTFPHSFLISDFITVGNTTNSFYNNRYSWIMDPNAAYMPLPKLPNNAKIYGGTGSGVLDVPIIDVYQHPRVSEWSFRYDDPARYAFVECNTSTSLRTIIFIVTYFTNDIITITT